jgi:hypothetical protein
MAESPRRSITRRAVVAGSAAFVPVMVAETAGARMEPPGPAFGRPEGKLRESRESVPAAKPAPDFASAQSGLRETADPIHAAIAAHACAYAAYAAQLAEDPGNDEAMEPLCEAEREAGDALAATVPATLEGAAAALAYVCGLHERDDHPLFDDYGCYVFITSTETAVRQAVEANRV